MASTISAGTTSGTAIAVAGDTSGVLQLQTNGTTTAVTINTSQGVQFLNSISVGNATPTTSGAGITFPASQSASSDANTLDDYEEGTFTATLTCGTSGSITMNTSFDQLAYIKIGKTVFIQGYVVASSISSPVGSLTINLPFSTGVITETAYRSAGTVIPDDIVALSSDILFIRIITDGVATANIAKVSTTGTIVNNVAANIKAGTGLYINLNYQANQ
jgi:hypothetical protein